MRWIKSRVKGSGRYQLGIRSPPLVIHDPFYVNRQEGVHDNFVTPVSMLPNFRSGGKPLLTDYFNEDPLATTAVELPVEDLLPGAEVQPSAGDGHDYLASHDLPLDVGIGVIFARLVVFVRAALRGESFEERLVVLQQALLVVVDVHAGGDVHGVHQHQSFADAALLHGRLYL